MAPSRCAAVVSLALLAAGCGGRSPGRHLAQVGPSENKTLAFSRCVRSNGVPGWPDPNPGGAFPKETSQQLGVSSSQLQAAQTACAHLLPNGGQPTRSALQQSWNDFRSFARCMRSHGVRNWPDPTRYPQHPERPTFELQAVGIDPASRLVAPRIHECEPLLHGLDPQHLG